MGKNNQFKFVGVLVLVVGLGMLNSIQIPEFKSTIFQFEIGGENYILERTDSRIQVSTTGTQAVRLKVSTQNSNFSHDQLVRSGSPLEIQKNGLGGEDIVIEAERAVQQSDLENVALESELSKAYQKNPESLVYSESKYFPVSPVIGADVAIAATLPASTTLRYTTFIPEYQVEAPYLVCTPGDNRSYVFLGDNRTWNVTSSSYKTRMNVSIDWIHGGTTSYSKSVHPTYRYVRVGGTYEFDQTATASSSTMHLRVDAYSSTSVAFELWQNVSNPLCNSALVGGIRFDYFIAIERAGFYSVEGIAVKVPNHEVYIMDSDDGIWKTVFRRNHVDFSCLEFWAYDPSYCTNSQSYYVTR
jgi:hypothetical protein